MAPTVLQGNVLASIVQGLDPYLGAVPVFSMTVRRHGYPYE